MSYTIRGLEPAQFRHLYGRSDAELAERGVIRMPVTEKPSAPCRVTLVDAEPGQHVLLVNYEHLPVETPYRARHAVFVREHAEQAAMFMDEVPDVLSIRLLSVRAYDRDDMMVDADMFEGTELDERIAAFFDDPCVAYLHAHNARRGCFAARIDRS